jgi:hypothetical protein
MSHFLTVPINENGIIIDQNITAELQMAAAAPFAFTDVFIYSHGWWNTASSAVAEYNVFSLGFARTFQGMVAADPKTCPRLCGPFSPLALGIHWPSMLSEDQDSVENFLEATSFFTMQQRADSVGRHAGYSLLRILLQARAAQPLRFNLIGHSFGCRVVLSALEAVAEDPALLAVANKSEFNVALIQAAADADSLQKGQLYGNVQSALKPLRILATVSANDTALGTWYPRAQELAHLFSGRMEAMGRVGPSGDLAVPVAEKFEVSDTAIPRFTKALGVADLTSLHNWHKAQYGGDSWSGQHSDINLPQIYQMLALFFGSAPPTGG